MASKKREKAEGRCLTCKHWNNRQAELEYSKFDGICNCFAWKFHRMNESDCKVLDRENRTEKHMGVNRFESVSNVVPFGKVEASRYVLVTASGFGCIHHEKV